MTTARIEVETEAVDRAISENVNTLLLRTHMKRRNLAEALGLPQATLNRHINGSGSWGFAEVRAIADYFEVTTEEVATGLPSFDEWKARWDVRHQGLEPRTRWLVAAGLRLVHSLPEVVNESLTSNRRSIQRGPLTLVRAS